MPNELKGLVRIGGAAWIGSGVLFVARAVLEFLAGVPPSSGVDILTWSVSQRTLLAISNEVLFFAALFLVPALFVLYLGLSASSRVWAATGCGVVGVTIPVMVMLDIIQGRLVYPVFGINARSPDIAEFIIAVFYGGLHGVYIIIGVGAVILSVAMLRAGYQRLIVYLGIIGGLLAIVGAYPYLIGPVLSAVCQMFFPAWFVAVGARLRRME